MSTSLASGYTPGPYLSARNITEPGPPLNGAPTESVHTQAEASSGQEEQHGEAGDAPTDSEARRQQKLQEAHAERRKEGYEDYGAEMSTEAKVWQIYVKETDRVDREMVEGWNKSLDMLLIFAALFSAISTAFVIVSSEELQEDPAETSAQALVAISQALIAISNGLPTNSSAKAAQESTTSFTPSRRVVLVNALWYFSLSLSVAASLVAMLAKEWCYSFMSNRSGRVYEQGRRRQERWNGILQWKMIDVMTYLPMVMHLALFLFALGLCLRLSSICITVALPVILTTGLAMLLYVLTILLPLVFDFCPYATASSRLFREYLGQYLKPARPHVDSSSSCEYIQHERASYRSNDRDPVNRVQRHTRLWIVKAFELWGSTLESLRRRFAPPFADAKLLLANGEVPMDIVTSDMVAWLLANCEDSTFTATAIRSLAGAEPWLPRLPLLKSGVLRLVYQFLEECFEFDVQQDAFRLKESTLAHPASLYLRALNYILAYHNSDGFYRLPHNDPQSGGNDINPPSISVENVWGLAFDTGVGRMTRAVAAYSESRQPVNIVSYSEAPDIIACGDIRHQAIASPSPQNNGRSILFQPDILLLPEYCDDLLQAETAAQLEQHITGEIVLHPYTIITMVRKITDKFCADKDHWFKLLPKDQLRLPILLVKLFCLLAEDWDQGVAHSIGVALMASALTLGDYPGGVTIGWVRVRSITVCRSRPAEAVAYHYLPKVLTNHKHEQMSLAESRAKETQSLLQFGLLGLLEHPNARLLRDEDLEILTRAIEVTAATHPDQDPVAYKYIHTLSETFTYDDHLNRVAARCLRTGHEDFASSEGKRFACAKAMRARDQHIAPLQPNCELYIALIKALCNANSSDGQALCCDMLEPLKPSQIAQKLVAGLQSDDVTNVSSLCLTSTTSERVRLTAMNQLWLLVEAILTSGSRSNAIQSLLRPLLPHDDSGIPERVWDMGLVGEWLPFIQSTCSNNPQMVMNSRVLHTMLQGCEKKLGIRRDPHRNDLEVAAERYQQDRERYGRVDDIGNLHMLAARCLSACRLRRESRVPQRPPSSGVQEVARQIS